MSNQDNEEIVVAKTYDDIGAATTAKERLEEAGIKAVIDDMNVAGMSPLAGIEIRVFERDLKKAVEILDGE